MHAKKAKKPSVKVRRADGLEQVLLDHRVEHQLVRERRRARLSEPTSEPSEGLARHLLEMRIRRCGEIGTSLYLAGTPCGRVTFDEDALWVGLYRLTEDRFAQRLHEAATRMEEPAEQLAEEFVDRALIRFGRELARADLRLPVAAERALEPKKWARARRCAGGCRLLIFRNTYCGSGCAGWGRAEAERRRGSRAAYRRLQNAWAMERRFVGWLADCGMEFASERDKPGEWATTRLQRLDRELWHQVEFVAARAKKKGLAAGKGLSAYLSRIT